MKSKTLKKTFTAPLGALAVTAFTFLLLARPGRGQAQEYEWSTIAGKVNENGFTDGKGSAARFKFPEGIAVDGSGTIYVADSDNHTIRKITPAGVVSTLAGRPGSPAFADGTGASARFNTPVQISLDASGHIFVADRVNHLIRRVTPAGVVSTVAGVAGECCNPRPEFFTYPNGVAVDAAGNVYVGDGGQTIRLVTPGGGGSVLAGTYGSFGHVDGTGTNARFHTPSALVADASGNIYVVEGANGDIRKITPLGEVSTLAGNPTTGGYADGQGQLAQFKNPFGLAIDAAGNLYVADSDNSTIRKVTPSGLVSTIGGSPSRSGAVDGQGSTARFNTPRGVAVDAYGVVYVADTFNKTIRKGVPLGGRTLTPRVVAVVGEPVPTDANGATYAKLTLAQGPFLGAMKVGTKTVPAIFRSDGRLLLKVGGGIPLYKNGLPAYPDLEIVALGAPSGGAVLAKFKPGQGGVTASNSDALLTGLQNLVGIAARRGDTLETPPVSGDARPVMIDKFVTIDGNGVPFFLAKLRGPTVTGKSDLALCWAGVDIFSDPIERFSRVMIRKGEDATGGPPSVKTVGTLVGAKGTLAQGRWRVGSEYFGGRLSFNSGWAEGLYYGSYERMAFADLQKIVSVGETVTVSGGTATIKSIGLPCFQSNGGRAFVATLAPIAGTIDRTNDVAVVVRADGPPEILAQKGGIPPDAGGSIVFPGAFKAFGAPVSGGFGGVAFTATLNYATGAAATGLWHSTNATTLRLLARGGDPAPGGGRFASFTSLVFPDGPTSGVIFTGTLAVSAAEKVTAANKSGLWAVNTHGALIGLLRTGDKIAGIAGQTRTVKSFRALEPAPGSIGAANGYDNEGHVAALVTFTDNTVALIELTIP